MSSLIQMPNGSSSSSKKAVGIEKIYQKKSQLEHILLRPDTYIGSVEKVTELMWVYSNEESKMIQKEITFVPGLYKIFDEILVNAADNKQRDKRMDCIKIDIDADNNIISIWNNGQGIPVVMHKEEKMFVPTMIFGHLLTSSNYNDEEEKVTGGRNGYGAKLCNIFSSKFTLETATKEYRKCFKQTWVNNMSKAEDPKIKEFSGSDYTKVTFSPDLAKFKMEKLDDDMVHLMCRRAYDIAASTRGVSVYLNGTKLAIKTFKDYIDLYLKCNLDSSGTAMKAIYENVNERWEVAISPSDRGFQQVSFVNSIATTKGGRHVDHVVDNIVKQLIEVLKKRNKGGISIKPFQVRNHIWVFVNCLIVNPTFDSQTKENMTLQAKSFGSKCSLSEKFITGVSKSGIVESVLSWAKFKAQNDLAKTSGKKSSKIKGIPKLEDANEAGGRNAHLCTLILTEGDSAKSLAVSGLGVVGRDLYGVFPLRGKLLNVREATHKQIMENAEINNLTRIVGLQYKKKYLTADDLKTLRYGKVMIMTDQDQDGSHIKGLLINFIHTNWPELLRLPFLEEFITPIVKATTKTKELSFYSLPEFEEWKNDTPNSKSFSIKYYKGLGTSTSKEAKQYFENMERHRIIFKYDGIKDDESILMAFSKKACDQRKTWLTNHMDECKRRKLLGLPERYLYAKGTKQITYTEFVNLELVLFSNADNVRSIPSMVDGFKPGQRKVIYTCFKRNDKKEVKVAQLSGSVAEKSAYHHGEVSLCMTIVNLAQNFVGSNNINLLQPRGQFGTRLTGGKDSASPRYIFTKLSPLARLIFHPADDPLLEYEVDDNLRIEPVWYIPIIPMVLVNGADGIGTGWSTKIPNHNPREIIQNIRRMIAHDEPKPMSPWYKNFNGTIEYIADGRYVTNGIISLLSNSRIEITELPVGTWTQTYKENVLDQLCNGSEKVKPIISDYREYHTDTTVRFVISFLPGEFERIYAEDGGFHRIFKLTGSIATSQMHCFDHVNCLRRFETSLDILKEFYSLRLQYYVRRKKHLEGQMAAEADKLTLQARFILEKCEKTIVVENKKRNDMIDELVKRGYKPDPVKEWQKSVYQEEPEEEVLENEEDPTIDINKKEDDKGLSEAQKFDYLLGMSMWMLTKERKEELLKQRDDKLSELESLKVKTVESLWLDDLDALEKKLNQIEEFERKDEAGVNKNQAKSAAKAKATAGALKKRKSGAAGDIFPDPKGVKIEFKVTDEILKKFEKAIAVKKEKGIKKEKVDKDSADKDSAGIVEIDEFDALVEEGNKGPKKKDVKVKKERKPRTKKADKEQDGLKQTTLDFKSNKSKKTSRKKIESGDDDDDYFTTGASDLEVTETVREKPIRRAATKKIPYDALAETDSDIDQSIVNKKRKEIDSDESFNENIEGSDAEQHKLQPKKRTRRVVSSDDSERDKKKKKPKCLISDDEDSDFQL